MTRYVLVLLAMGASAAQPDYFPLQPGNQWTYRASRFGTPFTIEVGQRGPGDPAGYLPVRGVPGADTLWLRMADDGTLYRRESPTGPEAVWAAFGAAEGQRYATAVDACNPSAVIRSKAAKADVPVGHVENALEISYPPANCADAGIASELYLPYIGLLQRTVTSFAGPVTYDLVYARLNDGLTIVTAPEQSFAIALDALTYKPGAAATLRLTLRNTQSQPLSLTFPSGQRFDVAVRNQKGETVYVWSADKLFIQMVGTLELTGEKTWPVDFPVPQAAGRYQVEAWLATEWPVYRVSAAIEVKP